MDHPEAPRLDRRRAVRALLASVSALALAPRAAFADGASRVRAPRALRIVLVGDADDALAESLAFGVAEASRSAQPFGMTVALERATSEAAVASARAATTVLFGGTRETACRAIAARARAIGALYVDAWCGAWRDASSRDADVIHALPSRTMRVDALARGGAAALGAHRWVVSFDDADRALGERALQVLAGAGIDARRLAPGDGGTFDAELVCGAEPLARRRDSATLRALAWHASLEAFGGAQLGQRYAQATHRTLDERAWAAWAGVKLVTEAALRAAPNERVASRLARADFIYDAHKGVALRVRASDRQLAQPLYLVLAEPGGATRVAATVPA